MLQRVTDDVLVHQSEFLQSNAVVVQGDGGLLLVDPGITSSEMDELADGLQELGQSVSVGYSTHPHWDHLLWHAKFGNAPRYGTVRNEKDIKDFLANADWKTQILPMLPADITEQIPTDELFGKITALPAGTTHVPWDGPAVQIREYDAHAMGSAALVVEESGVLIAGDMLSDILIPFLELDADDPIGDYLSALQLFEDMADRIKFFVPGHGSIGGTDELLKRITQDRAYVEALRGGGGADDSRLIDGPQKELLASVHQWQASQIVAK